MSDLNTLYLTTSDEDLRKAAEIIKAGGLVAFPTETVYGLGGNALNKFAAKAIYEAKGRPSDNPLIVHIAKTEELTDIAMNFPLPARKLAEAIWPGPMTMVLPKFDVVPDETTGGLNTVAIRCPANDAARRLIEYSGVPIAAPSANISGRPSPTRWEHVKADLDGKIDAVIMGEPCVGGIESTVVDMTEELPLILRPGLITPERISEVTGLFCDYDPAIKDNAEYVNMALLDPMTPKEELEKKTTLAPKAPGMKYKHYAPKAQMQIYSGSKENIMHAIDRDCAILEEAGCKVRTILYEEAQEAARNLFADLRAADEDECDVILASALSDDESVAYSVMNRMLKSAGYNITEV
ncbi:MAG: threonylcarbamoyl-AMP synthase [Firmicutes bacterium]|nr:threonylcarbamoyl-AMP synthase [Bacillota bacterium]